MKKAPLPKNEFKRIKSVYASDLLDTLPEERFDQLTRCATLIFHVPISTLTLIDANREWFKSCQGLSKTEGDRAISFCGHALVENEILIIKDTLKDERFADNPMVTGGPHIRFYAGVPIMSADGQRIGVFCIKNTKPREFSQEDEEEIFETYYKGPYFFNAKVFEKISLFSKLPFHVIELTKIYRQKDAEFIKILDAIRNGEATEDHLVTINKRADANFEGSPDDFYIHLTSTNKTAERINGAKLYQIQKDQHEFKGNVRGNFSERDFPTSGNLMLKEGAQIMLLNNDSGKRWVNGDVAKIAKIDGTTIFVELPNGKTEMVIPYTWKQVRYFYNQSRGHIDSEEIGSFTQYPIKLAWAVTIHKGQGKTFEKVIVNFGRGTFTPGQSYVALSRCTSLEGLVLRTPLEQRHIFIDERIKEFMDRFSK